MQGDREIVIGVTQIGRDGAGDALNRGKKNTDLAFKVTDATLLFADSAAILSKKACYRYWVSNNFYISLIKLLKLNR